jgi:thiamine-phosphate pyrophosphorylase
MKPLADCRLYGFVDTAYLHGRTPEVVCRELCDGGADLVQLRAKHESADWVRGVAEKLLPIAAAAGVRLVINDHLDVAQALGAPACHLGQEDFFDAGFTHTDQLLHPVSGIGNQVSGIRYPFPEIGLSTHASAQALRAVAAGADYIAIGPVFPTGTKPDAKPVTLEYVRWAAANVAVPWWAIGGITLENLDSVLEAGAKRICVVSAILNAKDIAAACGEFRRRLP